MDNASKNILITGGTGLIGSRLVKSLRQNGHFVRVLVRDKYAVKTDEISYWNVAEGVIDPECLDGIDTIIHLAGSGVADRRWTKKRKREIVDSRANSISLIYQTMRDHGKTVSTIISASGVGYYGDRGDEVLTEDSGNGSGFLANCCEIWEDAVDKGADLTDRLVKFRIGIVLNRYGGALVELERPVTFFAGAALGSGKQWIPWIHLYDMLSLLERAVLDERYHGVYNACSMFPVTNSEFTRTLARKLHRPVWPVNVPEFALKTILGEMAEVVLISTRTSAQKLIDNDFQFRYPGLDAALTEIYAQ